MTADIVLSTPAWTTLGRGAQHEANGTRCRAGIAVRGIGIPNSAAVAIRHVQALATARRHRG